MATSLVRALVSSVAAWALQKSFRRICKSLWNQVIHTHWTKHQTACLCYKEQNTASAFCTPFRSTLWKVGILKNKLCNGSKLLLLQMSDRYGLSFFKLVKSVICYTLRKIQKSGIVWKEKWKRRYNGQSPLSILQTRVRISNMLRMVKGFWAHASGEFTMGLLWNPDCKMGSRQMILIATDQVVVSDMYCEVLSWTIRI